jgi:3-oxoacyl-ACP reductase-like protein
MSLFGNILTKIFHHDSAKAAPPKATPAPAPASTSAAPSQPSPTPAPSPAPAPAPAGEQPASVDVGAVLESMASMKPDHGGNYQSSIVDLLKLLDLDSSLSARKELADELNVHVGTDGSAEENIALHRAVMDKLAENGGIVPDNLRS